MLHRATRILLAALFILTISVSTASAENRKINIASVGWTGVSIKTEISKAVLASLGYDVKRSTMSVPITYLALSKGDADFFLGNWMPSMETIAGRYFKDGSVKQFSVNMENAKYTLAVPAFCKDMGLKHFKDIAKFGDALEWKIYGIEPGNDGNMIILDMIKKDMFGLGKFKLIQSSEIAMLSQVMSFAKRNKPIVFLGWSPHSMNERIDMSYLDGSDSTTFGANNGTATVWTNTRKGLEKDNPNVAKFLKNLKFPVSMVNQIMTIIHKESSKSLKDVSMNWVKKHPEIYRGWLEGVKTTDGKEGVSAFEAYLKDKV